MMNHASHAGEPDDAASTARTLAPHASQPFVLSLALLLLLLVAYALRVYRLDGQSFWSDEGISLLRSAQPLGAMLADMPVEHMPGYFVLLHFWLRLTGTSDFALRYLSVLPSVLAVAILYRWGAEMMGGAQNGLHRHDQQVAPLRALLAATLLATSAFQVWYAQETRMYSWLLLAGMSANWFLWRLLIVPRPRWHLDGLGYGLSVAAGIYLHYYGFLVPAAHTVFAVGWVVATRQGRVFSRWLICGLAVLALFLPWLTRALAITGFEGWRDPGDPWVIPWRYLAAYTVSDAMPVLWRAWFVPLYAGLAGLGVIAWWRTRRAAGLLLAVNLLVPLAFVLGLALRNPDFHERYAIVLSAPLLLLVAGGLTPFAGVWPWIGHRTKQDRAGDVVRALFAALALLLIAANGAALYRHYTVEALQKPDFKGAAWRIQHEEGPGQVILVDGPDPEKVFLHYYTGPNPVHDLRWLEGESWETVDAYLSEATAGADAAWELLYFHAPGPVQVWLATRGWATGQSDHNDIRVIKYGLPGPALRAVELDIAFGDALTLTGAEVSAAPLRPGDLLRVSSHWYTQASPPSYKFSLRLLDGDGNPVLARDYVPQNGFAPTHAWIVGQPATDQRGILLPADLPPGRYAVALRLYDPASGVPVDTAVGQDIILGQVEILSAGNAD